jgi:lipopolysaccharide exporter
MTMPSERTTGMASGLAWTLAAMVTTRLVTLLGLSVLARLLAPGDFGLLAFALAYITYLTAIGDLGTTMALIYWPTRRDDAAQVTFLVTVTAGFIWLAGTVWLAPAIASFFGNPSGASVLIAIAWSVPIQALGSTHEALCRKSLQFKTSFAPEVALAATKAAISIALALAGFGVWSLVWGHLAGHFFRTILLWVIVPWRPTLAIPWDLVKPMFAYGRSIVAVNVLAVVVHHADLLIVARLLGVTALGFYQMAAKIPEMTITVLVRAVSSVLFPALSRLHAQGRNPAATYLTTLEGVALVTIPATVGLILMAEPMVFILFGERWAASIPIVQALTAVACFRALGTNAGDLLKAAGRPGTLVVLATIKAAVLIPALVWAADGGMVSAALAMMAVAGASMVLDITVSCLLTRTTSESVLASIAPGAVAGMAVAGGLTLAHMSLPVEALAVKAAIHLLVAAIAWAGAIRLVRPALYAEAVLFVRRARRIRQAATRPAGSHPRFATNDVRT